MPKKIVNRSVSYQFSSGAGFLSNMHIQCVCVKHTHTHTQHSQSKILPLSLFLLLTLLNIGPRRQPTHITLANANKNLLSVAQTNSFQKDKNCRKKQNYVTIQSCKCCHFCCCHSCCVRVYICIHIKIYILLHCKCILGSIVPVCMELKAELWISSY